MNLDIKAFLTAVFLVAAIGGVSGVVINMVSPAQAFCGAMKKDPQPNHADANCR